MQKEYRELFDGVRASGRLRMEVMNVTKQERTWNKRAFPKAALIAAVLVIALAGTAVAGSFGWIKLVPSDVFDDEGLPGYHAMPIFL